MTDTHTLPYTGERVPLDLSQVTVKITGEMQSREGVAFNAEVVAGKTVLGVIENQGHGGGTWFMQYDSSAGEWWDRMVEEFKPILAEDEPEFGDFMAAEFLADRLYENVALFRDLNRKRSVVVRIDGDNDQVLVYKGTWDAQLAAHFAAMKVREHKKIERWIKNQGWEAI